MAPSVLTDGAMDLSVVIYPRESVVAAQNAYAAFADIEIIEAAEHTTVRLTARENTNRDPLTIRREFLNYVLDLAIQSRPPR